MNLFVYGTLLDPFILRELISGAYKSEPGILRGYIRKKVSNREYPGLIKMPGAVTKGKIYYDITTRDILELDRYEGEEYERIFVDVLTANGEKERCLTYLYKEQFRSRLSDETWNFHDFVKQGRAKFLSREV